MNLKGKTLFITGGSRGIGHAIGLRAARDGANVVIAAKTVTENPKLPGTIYSAAEDMEKAGGQALAVPCDIRFEEQVEAAFSQAAERFGGIDILVNNASAISLTATEKTETKRYRLMHEINAGGTFLCTRYAIPYLKKSENPHVLTLSPPLNLSPRWFAPHLAYTMSKYGMSMCTLGHAAELKKYGIAVNSLWPETAIATAAVKNLLGGDDAIKRSRTPDIVADAAHWILTQSAKKCTGNFFIDSDVLKNAGIEDLSRYTIEPGAELLRDFFLDTEPPADGTQNGGTGTGTGTDGSASRYSCFALSFDGPIAHLKMVRPDRHNSMNTAFWQELPRAIDEIENHTEARVAILSADGPTFSSGMDLTVFQNPDNLAVETPIQRERLQRLVLHLQSVFNRVARCRVPVIAAVQGGAIGGGFDLICACALRYATRSAYFTIQETNLAMMADLGTLQRLPRLIHAAAAQELSLTGDKLTAERARELGLVGEVFDSTEELMAHVQSIAAKIAGQSPLAIAAIRQAINYSLEHDEADSLAMAAVLQAAIFNPQELMTAMKAQKTGSKAEYSDLLDSKISL